MSHPCHQCGAEVGEGNPFCRQCGAPQIRVGHGSGEEPPADELAARGSATGPISTSQPYASTNAGINRRLARKQAALAGILLAIITIILFSFSLWLVLLIPLPALLAVQLYYRDGPGQRISSGAGAGIGLLTGLIGFLIFSLPAFPFVLWHLALHPDPEVMQQFRTQMQIAVRSSSNPQAQQIMNSLLSPGGLVFICIVAFLFLLVLILVLSAIGGAIGANLSKRR